MLLLAANGSLWIWHRKMNLFEKSKSSEKAVEAERWQNKKTAKNYVKEITVSSKFYDD